MRDQSEAIEFGVSMRLLKEVVAEAQLVESLGYDYLLTGEHISFHGPTPNTLISLSAAAAVTERIKLLSGIVLVPLYPPALLAKLIATLDTISHGRYCFGIGIGEVAACLLGQKAQQVNGLARAQNVYARALTLLGSGAHLDHG